MDGQITLKPTKTGNGYKIFVKGVWYYCSKKQFNKLVDGERDGLVFNTIKETSHYPESQRR